MWPSKKGGFAAADAATRTSSKHSGPFKTLTVRRCSGHDWSPVMLQVALALRSRLLHCSFSCTLLWSRRSYLCCNDTVFVERCVRVCECVCARARSYFQALELRRAFPTVVLQLGLLGRQPHRLQSQVHLLHAELGPQLQVRKKTRRITYVTTFVYITVTLSHSGPSLLSVATLTFIWSMNAATMLTFWVMTAAIFSAVSASTFFRSMTLFSICFRLKEQGKQVREVHFHSCEPECQTSGEHIQIKSCVPICCSALS